MGKNLHSLVDLDLSEVVDQLEQDLLEIWEVGKMGIHHLVHFSIKGNVGMENFANFLIWMQKVMIVSPSFPFDLVLSWRCNQVG